MIPETILAWDTSSATTSVAVRHGDKTLVAAHTASRGHVEFLLPAVLRLLEEAGTSLAGVGAIAVGVGPGLFTGLRVGVQTAKSIATTASIPLVAVSSLEALAASIEAPGRILACMQAHRGEVFAAPFERREDGTLARIDEDRPMPPSEAAALAAETQATLVGNGPASYPEAFGAVEVLALAPTGSGVLAQALPRLAAGDHDDPVSLEPAYLRRSEAEIRWGETGVTALRPDRIRFRSPA